MKKKHKQLAVSALALAIAIPSVVTIVDSTKAEAAGVTGTYVGTGFTLTYETINATEAKVTDIQVNGLTGKYAITIPETVNGVKLVQGDFSVFEKLSAPWGYQQTGKWGVDYLDTLNLPSTDFKLTGTSIITSKSNGIKYIAPTKYGFNIIWHNMASSGMSYIDEGVPAIAVHNTGAVISLDELVVPDTVFGQEVRALSMFKGLKIDTLVLPTTLEIINKSAFATVNKTTVKNLDLTNLPNIRKTYADSFTLVDGSVVKIGSNFATATHRNSTSFENDTNPIFDGVISKLIFDETVTTIPTSVLFNETKGNYSTSVKLNEVIFPSTLKTIGEGVFRGTQIRTMTLPEGLQVIGARAFFNSKYIKEIELPLSVENVGIDAFGGTETLLDTVIVRNDYLTYATSNKPFALSPTGKVYANEGSTTELVYKTSGFRPLSTYVPPNTAPSTNGVIPDITTEQGKEVRVSLEPYFKDKENNSLTYEVSVNDANATAHIEGGTLVFNSSTLGTYTLSVKAKDSEYYSPESTFQVTVEEATQEQPTKSALWTFDNPTDEFVTTMVPEISVLGGKVVEGVKLNKVDLGKATTITTELGDVTFTPDGKGNTLVSMPNGLGNETTDTTLDVQHNGLSILNVVIKPKPVIKFDFSF